MEHDPPFMLWWGEGGEGEAVHNACLHTEEAQWYVTVSSICVCASHV